MSKGKPVAWQGMPEPLQNFETAFLTNSGHSRMECECGRVYYNGSGDWDWEPGELEQLEKDPEAISVDYTIGEVAFESKTFANPCDCWHARANQIMGFIDSHGAQIAEWLTLEKQRKQKEAESSPVVK